MLAFLFLLILGVGTLILMGIIVLVHEFTGGGIKRASLVTGIIFAIIIITALMGL